MFNYKQFLKCPPIDNTAKSQFLKNDSKVSDDDAKTSRRRRNKQKPKENLSLDDSSKWVTDDEDNSNWNISSSRRRKKLCDTKEDTKLRIMREIFEAQTDEVKQIVIKLHKLHSKQKKTFQQKQLTKSKPLLMKKQKKQQSGSGNKKKRAGKSIVTAAPRALQFNCKLLARLQRRRRHRGKPKSQKKKKFPRRKGCSWSKKGNRQGRKRYFRAQKLFDKGIFIAGRKLFDEVLRTVKDPKSTATSFCNNNIHGLNKLHRKQLALYERIEEDLHRLDVTRQERNEAAIERHARQQEKDNQRQGFKNRIELRQAARAEREALRKQRRAARKKRALEKRMRKEEAKMEMIRCME